MIVGVLALQGGFQDHLALLRRAAKTVLPADLSFEAIPVRTVEQLNQCDALILPGGESTTMTLLATKGGLLEPLRQFVQEKKAPTWGTCAGMIMLADEVLGGALSSDTSGKAIGGFPIRVCRNQYGRQSESFEQDLQIQGLRDPETPFVGIFIRAPITHSRLQIKDQDSIEVVATIPRSSLPSSEIPDAQPPSARQIVELGPDACLVAMKHNNILVSSFHPELTTDPRVHELWLRDCVLPRLTS